MHQSDATFNLTHDIYTGYWGNNVSGFVNQAPTYSYTDGWSASRWKHFYDDRSTSEYSQLVKTFYFCNKDYYHTAFYITRIYYAFLLSMQTDTYGSLLCEGSHATGRKCDLYTSKGSL